jgi:hypothetical protein
MMPTIQTRTGILRGTLAAGPLFVTLLAAGLALGSNAAIPLGAPGTSWLAAPAVLMVATLPGALLAIVPILLGTAALARLGLDNPGLRHPAAWALAGAGVVLAATIALDAAEPAFTPALAATAAACALLARSGVHWPDR